ncbi:hypothetical protein As57867_006414, partial [Aphanomyces stellatus]
ECREGDVGFEFTAARDVDGEAEREGEDGRDREHDGVEDVAELVVLEERKFTRADGGDVGLDQRLPDHVKLTNEILQGVCVVKLYAAPVEHEGHGGATDEPDSPAHVDADQDKDDDERRGVTTTHGPTT